MEAIYLQSHTESSYLVIIVPIITWLVNDALSACGAAPCSAVRRGAVQRGAVHFGAAHFVPVVFKFCIFMHLFEDLFDAAWRLKASHHRVLCT